MTEDISDIIGDSYNNKQDNEINELYSKQIGKLSLSTLSDKTIRVIYNKWTTTFSDLLNAVSTVYQYTNIDDSIVNDLYLYNEDKKLKINKNEYDNLIDSYNFSTSIRLKLCENIHNDYTINSYPDDEKKDITIKLLIGKVVIVKVHPLMTIGEIKKLIYNEEGTPYYLQRLICGGKELDDSKTLSSYDICNKYNYTFHMVKLIRKRYIEKDSDGNEFVDNFILLLLPNGTTKKINLEYGENKIDLTSVLIIIDEYNIKLT
jgi:hypothetical protein